jgi:undecaprenyl-diphosphatase
MDSLKIYAAKYLFVAVVLVLGWVWIRQTRRRKVELAVATVIAGLVALVVSRVAAKFYYDPRPFVASHVKPLIAHAADNGFPSDHALLAATLSAVTYACSKKWGLVAFGLAILVGLGRVLVHVHSPIDIIGGFAIGIFAGWLGWLTAQAINKRGLRPADGRPDGPK